MEEEIKYIYLDTSAINKIAKFSDEYIEKILNNMKRINHYFVISEIDLIEIFNNQNVEIREKLVITLQKIIQVELITNPELLLIASLEKDDSLIDKYKYLTNDINNTFIDILENKDKTFVLSKESEKLLIEKNKAIKKMNLELIKKIIDYKFCQKNNCNENCKVNKRFCHIYKQYVALNLALLILTPSSVSLSDVLKTYWKEKNLLTISQIAKYIQDRKSNIIEDESLFMNLSHFLLSTVVNSEPTRGTKCDIMHSIYAGQCHLLLSEDDHFKDCFDEIITQDVDSYIKSICYS